MWSARDSAATPPSRQPDDFFEVQRGQRIRSRIIIGGIFVLLWAVANAAFFLTHRREVCEWPDAWPCQTIWDLNMRTVALSALAVAGYLAAAHWRAQRWAVSGNNIRSADTPGGLVFRNVVEEVAIAAGIPKPNAYIIDDPSLNAYAVSNGRRVGAVLCTTGLLAALDRRELTGVVAHEIAHIRNRDSTVILVGLMSVGALIVLATVAWAIASAAGDAEGESDLNDDDEKNGSAAGIGLVAGLAAVILWVVAIPAALLLHASLSRRREQLADAAAVQYTRDPSGLRGALEKIASSPIPSHSVTAANQALWIDSPRRLGQSIPIGRWLNTHPPIEQRIAWLRTLEGASTAR